MAERRLPVTSAPRTTPRLARRQFLRGALILTGGAALLTACQPAPAAAPTAAPAKPTEAPKPTTAASPAATREPRNPGANNANVRLDVLAQRVQRAGFRCRFPE